MSRRIFQDLPAEAVSEETFSTHANTETKKRLDLDPDLVSDFVFCNKNDRLYFERIRAKIRPMYDLIYRDE